MPWMRGEKRKARREKRQATRQRKNAKNEGLKYLGGGKDEEQKLYDEARKGKQASAAREEDSASRLEKQTDKTNRLADSTRGEYALEKSAALQSLADQRAGITNIGLAEQRAQGYLGEAQAARTNALNSTAMPPAAQAAIEANARNTQAQLSANLGLTNRSMMGLAAGQGEGGALAMQQAMAQAGQGGYDAMVQSQLLQNQQAADIRAAERANMLQTANANAGEMGAQAQLAYGAAQNQQQAQAQLAQQRQAQQQLASQRQTNFVGQANQMASTEEQAALENQGQNMQYQSGLLTARFGAQQDRQDRSTIKKIFFPLGMLGGK